MIYWSNINYVQSPIEVISVHWILPFFIWSHNRSWSWMIWKGDKIKQFLFQFWSSRFCNALKVADISFIIRIVLYSFVHSLKSNQIGDHKLWKSVQLWRTLRENRCLCVLGLSFQHTTTIVPTLIWRNIEQTRWPLIATRWPILQIEINHRLFRKPSPLVLSSFWQ